MTEQQYAEAFVKYYPNTRRALMGNGAKYEEADEVAQAAWVKGWEHREQLRDPTLILPWVISIARNLLRASFRKNRDLSFVDLDENSEWFATEWNDAENSKIDASRLLESVSAPERALLQLFYIEGYANTEIASMEAVTSNSIRIQKHRILTKLSFSVGRGRV